MVASLVYPVLGLVGSIGISGFIFLQEFNHPYWYYGPEEVSKIIICRDSESAFLKVLYYVFGVSLVIASYVADSRIIYVQGLLICIFYLFGREIYHSEQSSFFLFPSCFFSPSIALSKLTPFVSST